MDIKTRIGLRIKDLRTEKSLTQEAFAWKAEGDRTFMNHIENGERNVLVETLCSKAYQLFILQNGNF